MSSWSQPRLPDARLMQRLQWQLRQTAAPAAFVAAAEALATALGGAGPLPAWAETLADTLVGSLMLVEANADCDEVSGVDLARAALVLSVARPKAARACDHAAARFLARSGDGMGRPVGPGWGLTPAEQRVSQILLAAWVGDVDAVEIGATRLAEDGESGWAVAFARLARALRDDTNAERQLAWAYVDEAAATFDGATASFTVLLAVIRLGRGQRDRGMAREAVGVAWSDPWRSRLAG